jgi:hypothetical protein
MVPSLDHPPCVRFTTRLELSLLEKSREICKMVMRVFTRCVSEDPPEGIKGMEDWELIITVLNQSRDSDYVHPLSVHMITEAFWAICTAACPDENTGGQILKLVIEDLEESQALDPRGSGITWKNFPTGMAYRTSVVSLHKHSLRA